MNHLSFISQPPPSSFADLRRVCFISSCDSTFLTAAKEAVDDQRRKLETEVESLRSLLNEATSQEPRQSRLA